MPRLRNTCGTKTKLKNGGFIECGKPGVVVEMSHQRGSNRCFMCTDHIRIWQEAGCVIRTLEGDDAYIPRRPGQKEELAKYACKICNRLFGEHSHKEFDDHFAQIAAPTTRLYPKGKIAKKEDLRGKCCICDRPFHDHSQQEYDAHLTQHSKRHKPYQEDLVYVKCEICGRRFGDHSEQEFDACIDQLIDNQISR